MPGAVETNAAEVAIEVRRLGPQLDAALDRAMRLSLNALERNAVRRLSGSGAAWTYPVPVRTGNLRRSLARRQPSALEGLVVNTAAYAWAIHEGEIPVRTPGGGHTMRRFTRRPYMDDAATDTDVYPIFERELGRALQ